MRVYRLCKAQYSEHVLGGEGGLVADGRWHTAGRRIVYCATSEALAVLEVRVHVGRFIPNVPFDMHTLEVPDVLIHVQPARDLTEDWSAVPHRPASQAIGDAWLQKGRHVALRVPPLHSRSDANVLLNPAHRDLSRVRLIDTVPYRFDTRLF